MVLTNNLSLPNKRGQMSTIQKLILILIVLALMIFLFNKVYKGSTKVLSCTSQGGTCTVGTCDFGTQVPVLGDKAAGCGTDEICCVDIDKQTNKPDESCLNKDGKKSDIGTGCTIADPKNGNGYCNAAGKCVDQCSFCSTNSLSDAGKKLCAKKSTDAGYFDKNKGLFSCSCTKTECTATMIKEGKCILNYCGATGANSCCVK